MTNLIDDLAKRYNVNMVAYLANYQAGDSREVMAEKLNVSVPTVRLIATLLHLRLKKKFREVDYANLERKLANDDKNPDAEILENHLDKAISDLVKAEKIAKKLTLENAVLKRKMDVYKKQGAKEESIESIFEDKAELLASLLPNTKVNQIFIHKENTVPFEGLCVALSDLHIGAVVESEEVGGVNKFNYHIAENRMQILTQSVLDFPKQSELLTVFIIGDILDGVIHGAINTAEDSFVESVARCSQMIYESLAAWASVYKVVEVNAVTGNHGRVSEQPAFNKKYADYEYLVIRTVEKMLQAGGVANVQINFSKSGYIFSELNGTKILAHHGDQQRNLNITNTKAIAELQAFCMATFGDSFVHTLSGHWHKPLTVSNQFGGYSIQAGSLIGTNNFSYVSGFAPTKASQPIFFVEENGDIDLVQHTTLQ